MNAGKTMIVVGMMILLVGVIVYFFHNKMGWFGNLPGDVKIERESVKFYFPITTMILVSLLISLAFQIWRWLR